MRHVQPDLAIARCKALLKESIFSVPGKGTFVMHPGICPSIATPMDVSGRWQMVISTKLA